MTQSNPNAPMNAINVDVIEQFHNNDGKIESGMFKGARLAAPCLAHLTRACSSEAMFLGLARSVPGTEFTPPSIR